MKNRNASQIPGFGLSCRSGVPARGVLCGRRRIPPSIAGPGPYIAGLRGRGTRLFLKEADCVSGSGTGRRSRRTRLPGKGTFRLLRGHVFWRRDFAFPAGAACFWKGTAASPTGPEGVVEDGRGAWFERSGLWGIGSGGSRMRKGACGHTPPGSDSTRWDRQEPPAPPAAPASAELPATSPSTSGRGTAAAHIPPVSPNGQGLKPSTARQSCPSKKTAQSIKEDANGTMFFLQMRIELVKI